MKKLLLVLIVFLPEFVSAQEATTVYEPLDKLGWTLKNFSEPENITELDSGRVKYLVALNKNGYVKNIEILQNTFREEAERAWREIVEQFEFEQKNYPADKPRKYKGLLIIESKSGRDD